MVRGEMNWTLPVFPHQMSASANSDLVYETFEILFGANDAYVKIGDHGDNNLPVLLLIAVLDNVKHF